MDDRHSDLWPSSFRFRVSSFRCFFDDILPTELLRKDIITLDSKKSGRGAYSHRHTVTRCLEEIPLAAPLLKRVHTRAPSGELQFVDGHHAARRVLIFLRRLPVNHDDRSVCRAWLRMHLSVGRHCENFYLQALLSCTVTAQYALTLTAHRFEFASDFACNKNE